MELCDSDPLYTLLEKSKCASYYNSLRGKVINWFVQHIELTSVQKWSEFIWKMNYIRFQIQINIGLAGIRTIDDFVRVKFELDHLIFVIF